MNRRVYIWLALVALAFWAFLTFLRRDFQSGPDIGQPAPVFRLPALGGSEISLEDFRGRAVILNFWASWCGPCRQEMPSLEALYQKFQNRGLVVLGVSVDEEGWPPVKEFLEGVPVSFPIVLDKQQRVAEQYETYRVPETYFISPEGEVAGKVVGPQDYDQQVFFNKVERILPGSNG